MTRAIQASLVILLIAVSAATLLVAHSIDLFLTRTYQSITPEMALLRRELTLTRQDLIAQAALMNYQLSLVRQDIHDQLSAFNYTAKDLQLDLSKSTEAAAYHISHVSTKIATLAESLNMGTAILSVDTHELLARALEREPMIYSRFLATTGELNRTLDAMRRSTESVAVATPQITSDLKVITENTAQITNDVRRYTKPENFWKWLILLPLRSLRIHLPR